MTTRTQLEDAAALLALHTDAELDAMRKDHPKQDLNRQAERCVNWWNNTKGGAVRWKQAFGNWMKRDARYYANGTNTQRTEGHDPVAKFRDARLEQRGSRGPSPRLL